jgi:ATP-dependent DNA helicase PIF1
MTETLSTEQKEAYDAIMRGESIFLTGPGGTGKSHLIKLISQDLLSRGKIVAITAMTGCASVLLGNDARTFHSWSGIGLGKDSALVCLQNMKSPTKKRWKSTDVLIIDEISMAVPEMIEMVDEIAKRVRSNSAPMGGIQVIFVGDFFQLPPVVKGAKMKFVFESPIWSSIVERSIELKRIFRQEDVEFQHILDEARIGELSTESLLTLKKRCNLSWKDEPIQPTLVFSKNMNVDMINESKLNDIEEDAYTFSARFPLTETPIPATAKYSDASFVRELTLKVGTQVMLIINLDQEKGLVNGSRGVVTGFKDDEDCSPIVLFRNGKYRVIKHHIWKDLFVEQIPLRVAYALTIHKSQGATLDCAQIDIGSNIFEYGQAYVALSRVKSIDSLYVHDISKEAFRAHPAVKEFYKNLSLTPYKPRSKQATISFLTHVAPAPAAAPSATPSAAPSVKRKTPPKPKPLTGKKASYSFADEESLPVQQSSLTKFWGVPKKSGAI